MPLKFVFRSKRMKAIKAIKVTSCFEVVLLSNAESFLLQNIVILLFFHLESLIKLFTIRLNFLDICCTYFFFFNTKN